MTIEAALIAAGCVGVERVGAVVFASGAALAMLGVTLVALASHPGRSLAGSWPYLALALACAATPLVTVQTLPLLALILLLAVGQVALSVYVNRAKAFDP